jgi:DNA-binding MarR family transcriptional regulator
LNRIDSLAENLKQLLLASSDWFAEEVMKGVQNTEYAFITPAQSRLLAHMGGKPMTMAELARRLAISRQAVHKTVNELARRGLLEVKDDPLRRHGKLVLYTETGRQLNRTGAQLIDTIEHRVSRKIGAPELLTLKRLLSQLT